MNTSRLTEPLVGFTSAKPVLFKSDEIDEFVSFVQSNVDLVDACFVDPLGLWHHITFTVNQCTPQSISNGWGFDGSSIRLFKTVTESDMILKPDISTCFIDPFMKHKVLHVTCDVLNHDGSESDRCSRTVLRRAEKYLYNLGICTNIYVGPEVEFFIFENVVYKNEAQESCFKIECKDGYWNSSKPHCVTEIDHGCPNKNTTTGSNRIQSTNHGQYMLKKQLYVPTIPVDQSNNIRADMLLTLQSIGIVTEKHHHEVACGQQELGIEFDDMLRSADNIMVYKYCVKNCAALAGKSATFMPKPMDGDNGSGMHTHVSVWKDGVNLFYDPRSTYLNLSKMALQFIGGILKHSSALLAFCCPTVNSYKRLLPGYEAPCLLTFSGGNRTAAIRIPLSDGKSAKATRIEFRCPDPSCNPYLAIAAIVLAGMDGVLSDIELPNPWQDDDAVDKLPGTLLESLEALDKDRDFLTRTGAFTNKYISAYIEYKRQEYAAINKVPTPMEYEYYYAI